MRNINWAQFEPITGLPNYPTTNRIPYTEEYMLSLERGLGANTVLSLNYVGTQGHRLLVLDEANPGNPSLCLFLSNPANLAPGQTPCGPFGEDSTYTTSTGQVYNGTRGPLGSNFGSDANQATIGNSNYNALQITLRHTSKRLNVLAGYTYSKSQDQSSNVGEEVNPLDPSLSKALSAFDVKHNFVVSYSYQIPFERLFHATNRWTQGWELSGITHFSTGLPVTLVNYGDNSLLGAEPNGINNFGVDEPDYTGGPLDLNHNPRNGQSYFNTVPIQRERLGHAGHRQAALLLRAGDGQLRYGAAQERASDRIEVPPVSGRRLQCFQPRAVLRTASRRWQYRQLHVRPSDQRGPAPPRSVGREILLLDTLAPTQVISKRCRALKLPRLSVGERSCGP